MSEMDKNNDHSRREFVKVTAATTVGAAVAMNFGRLRPASAAGSDEIRVGLVGCGGRGTGAAAQALKAAPGVKLIAMADAFKDRLDTSHSNLNKDGEIAKNIDVPADRQFVGLDAYQKLLKTDVNYVIIASPPGFKADQITAAVAAGKHIFAEKPMAVDGPTLRACFAAAEEAKKKGLGVGIGLQRRHQKGYLEAMKRVRGGQIGEITSGRVFWNQGGLWMKKRDKSWSDLEWQMRNWLYFTWLSGDHIVEQHIHNIDIANWGIGKPPVAAVAVGGRQQRVDPAFGNIYDHFAVDFEYPNDVHVMSMCRQIPNCANDISEHLVGTRGRADLGGKTSSMKTGKKTWTHDGAKDVDPYLQEHIDLITSIRKGKPLNELKSATESNLAAVMGRMAAYTGKKVTYDQALNSKESLVPKTLDWKSKMTVPPVPTPGASDII